MQQSLRQIRRARGLTLEELATLANVGASTIGNFETGRARISPETLNRLAKVLKVDPADITIPGTSTGTYVTRDSNDYLHEKLTIIMEQFSDAELLSKAHAALDDKDLTIEERARRAIYFLEEIIKRPSSVPARGKTIEGAPSEIVETATSAASTAQRLAKEGPKYRRSGKAASPSESKSPPGRGVDQGNK